MTTPMGWRPLGRKPWYDSDRAKASKPLCIHRRLTRNVM